MTRSPSFPLRSPLLPLAAALLAALPALAQQAPGADNGQLETITVTATKRPQSLQTTPIAITVLNGGALEESNLNTLGAVTSQTPTVNFRTNASNKDTALFIRGVGTISTSPGVEPTVSTVLDGVVTARPGQATMDLLDIDRVEILRGPQGTLFGKNASAGVINIVSKAPGKATERFVDLSLMQGNERRLRLGVSGELKEGVVRGGISAMVGKYDGNVTNAYDGSSVNGYDRKGVRGRLDMTPSKQLKISLIADYMKAADDTPTGVVVGTTTTAYATGVVTQNPKFAAALLPVVPSADNRRINSDLHTRVADTNSGLSAQVDYDLGAGFQLTSISALRQWKNNQFQDQDRLGSLSKDFARSHDIGNLDFKQASQELRIASPKGGFFDYVAGLFYIDAKDDERYERDVSRCAASTAAVGANGLTPCSAGSETLDNGIANYGTHNKSASVFGEGTFNFSPQLRAIAGLRYTKDDLSYYHGRVATNTGVPGVGATRTPVTGSTNENAVSGRVGPQYQLNPDTMLYATVSKGYKGPAYNVFFNMTALQDNVLRPETSRSVEAGFKTTVMDNRVRLNVAAFKTDYADYQANVPDLVNGAIVTRLINAGDVSTKGVEFDMAARITSQFVLNAAAANIIARVKSFNCPTGAALSCNINGQPLPYSPDWKASIRGKYTMALPGGMTLDISGDYGWQSKVQYDLAQSPDAIQPAYGILGASVAIAGGQGWRVALIGRNLGNKSYAAFLQNSGTNINRYVPRDDQRYFGINARYEF